MGTELYGVKFLRKTQNSKKGLFVLLLPFPFPLPPPFFLPFTFLHLLLSLLSHSFPSSFFSSISFFSEIWMWCLEVKQPSCNHEARSILQRMVGKEATNIWMTSFQSSCFMRKFSSYYIKFTIVDYLFHGVNTILPETSRVEQLGRQLFIFWESLAPATLKTSTCHLQPH